MFEQRSKRIALRMSSDGETGAAALARKLAHPLGKIRARALQRLLSKLCARLLAPAALEAQAAALAPRLLAALREPALEPDALRVLELLVEVRRSRHVATQVLG